MYFEILFLFDVFVRFSLRFFLFCLILFDYSLYRKRTFQCCGILVIIFLCTGAREKFKSRSRKQSPRVLLRQQRPPHETKERATRAHVTC
jgi:hypothetical protein